MRYDLSTRIGKEKAETHFKALLSNEKLIDLKEVRKQRTLSQNALYWLYMACLEQETGNDKYDLHEYFKIKFNGIEIKNVFGTPVYTARSTTKNDTKQMGEYLDKIIQFASQELSIALPDPSDKYFNDFYEQYKGFIHD